MCILRRKPPVFRRKGGVKKSRTVYPAVRDFCLVHSIGQTSDPASSMIFLSDYTSSRRTFIAPSPGLWAIFTMRVYPPFRFSYFGAISSNIF